MEIMSCIEKIVSIWRDYWQGTAMFAFLAIAILYFIKYRAEHTDVLIIYSGILLLLFSNPSFYWLIVEKMSLDTIYPRILLCIPVSLIVAYAMTRIVMHGNQNKKVICKRLIMALLLTILCGECVYTTDAVRIAENVYHIPQEAIDIVTILQEDSNDLTQVTVAMPNYPSCRFVQLYDVSFKMPYGRRGWGSVNEAKELYELLRTGEANYMQILLDAYICNCNYLVIYQGAIQEEYLLNGCRLVGLTENYAIYCMEDYSTEDEIIKERRREYAAIWKTQE